MLMKGIRDEGKFRFGLGQWKEIVEKGNRRKFKILIEEILLEKYDRFIFKITVKLIWNLRVKFFRFCQNNVETSFIFLR